MICAEGRRGKEIRKEDEFSDPLNPLEQLILYAGYIDKSTIPSVPITGQLFFTNDVVTIDGIEYPSGCMLLYDGSKWINVGDFVHQIINHWVYVDKQPKNII